MSSTPAATAKPGQFTAMISSTSLDLPEHRAAVKEACLAAGIFPVGMEHLPARDANGIAVSLEMVDKADIYIGIYAWRYGWVPKGESISVTEMEFDHALARQKSGQLHELLIFTAHDDHPFTKKDIETGDVPQKKLAEFKTRACDGRVRAQFASVEQLRRHLAEALHHFLERHRAKEVTTTPPAAFIPPHSTIPHNLPTLQPFFGREDELQKIAEALEPAARTWGALIDGPGGMGKTSLAVRAAYAVSPEVFHKIVFVSLKSRELDDDGLRDLSGFMLSGIVELFSELARQLGHAEILKAAEDQRPRLLLDVLAGTQTLLVLDNLEGLLKKERDTVFTFVKRLPAGCKAILTSRGRIGSAAEELILEKLSEQAALATLEELATRNPLLALTSEAERLVLYRETGGKPLLLRWIAGQIGRGHCITFTDAIAHLRSCPEDNDPLEFIFGDLVEDFSEAETRVLCALTYFTQPAKVEHIAAIAGMEAQAGRAEVGRAVLSPPPGVSTPPPSPTPSTSDHAETDRALRSLVNRSLAVPSDEFQTFHLVPMVADFLHQKKPRIIAETGARLEQRAHALILENGAEKHDRFPVMDAAWPTVAAAIPRFLTGPNERLQEVCEELFTFLNFTGRWDEWHALNRQAEARAVAEAQHVKAGWRAYHSGWIHRLRGQVDAMLDCVIRAEAHWQRAFPPGSGGTEGIRERAFAIRMRGLVHRMRQEFTAAITAYHQSLDLLYILSAESQEVACLLYDLASVERQAGDFAAAERDYSEAFRMAHAVGFAEAFPSHAGALAALALDQKDWPGAETLAREALPLSEKLGRQDSIASTCYVMAEALARQGKGAEGLPYARRATEVFSRLGIADMLKLAQATLAECEAAIESAQA